MKLYVAGPMTGYPRWNFDAFDEATARLRAAGYEVISPAEIELEGGFDPEAPVGDFTIEDRHAAMRRDLDIVLHVDGIVALDGWQASDGARTEINVALSIGTRVKGINGWLSLAERSAA